MTDDQTMVRFAELRERNGLASAVVIFGTQLPFSFWQALTLSEWRELRDRMEQGNLIHEKAKFRLDSMSGDFATWLSFLQEIPDHVPADITKTALDHVLREISTVSQATEVYELVRGNDAFVARVADKLNDLRGSRAEWEALERISSDNIFISGLAGQKKASADTGFEEDVEAYRSATTESDRRTQLDRMIQHASTLEHWIEVLEVSPDVSTLPSRVPDAIRKMSGTYAQWKLINDYADGNLDCARIALENMSATASSQDEWIELSDLQFEKDSRAYDIFVQRLRTATLDFDTWDSIYRNADEDSEVELFALAQMCKTADTLAKCVKLFDSVEEDDEDEVKKRITTITPTADDIIEAFQEGIPDGCYDAVVEAIGRANGSADEWRSVYGEWSSTDDEIASAIRKKEVAETTDFDRLMEIWRDTDNDSDDERLVIEKLAQSEGSFDEWWDIWRDEDEDSPIGKLAVKKLSEADLNFSDLSDKLDDIDSDSELYAALAEKLISKATTFAEYKTVHDCADPDSDIEGKALAGLKSCDATFEELDEIFSDDDYDSDSSIVELACEKLKSVNATPEQLLGICRDYDSDSTQFGIALDKLIEAADTEDDFKAILEYIQDDDQAGRFVKRMAEKSLPLETWADIYGECDYSDDPETKAILDRIREMPGTYDEWNRVYSNASSGDELETLAFSKRIATAETGSQLLAIYENQSSMETDDWDVFAKKVKLTSFTNDDIISLLETALDNDDDDCKEVIADKLATMRFSNSEWDRIYDLVENEDEEGRLYQLANKHRKE